MTLTDRVFYIAAGRDRSAIEYISGLQEKEKGSLGGTMGFVRVKDGGE